MPEKEAKKMIRTKDRRLRRLIKFVLTSISLLLVLCFLTQEPIFTSRKASAAERIVYLKEVKVFEADSEKEARAACEKEGFTFVEKDLNKGAEKGGRVYMGYKTTENREEALYKIAILDMNGGFQIKNYNEMYEEFRKSNYSTAETLQMATTEFIDSYNNGSPKAIDAYNGLNLLSVPEVGEMKFGDYVVKGKTTTDFYARVLTESSNAAINSIISLLYAGLAPYQPETGDDDEEPQQTATWAGQMSDSSLWDVVGGGNLSQDEKDRLYRQYGDDAKALFRQMQEFATNFENSMASYNEEDMKKRVSGDSLEETVDNMDEIKQSDAGALYLNAYKMLNEYDANSDMPLGEWIVEMGKQTSEEVDLTQIYPMIDSMSYAQVRMTELAGFVPCASGLSENAHSEEYQKLLDTTANKIKDLIGKDSLSIWTNTDPDFAKSNVAFTSFAIRQNAAQAMLNGEANDSFAEKKEDIETAIKWLGVAGSAATVLGFVGWVVGGALLHIAEYAAISCLMSVASTMVTVSACIFKYAGYFGLAVLGFTLLFYGFCVIRDMIKEEEAKDYTTIPDYVIDAVKVKDGYANVKYKAVKNNKGKIADLNAYNGFNGWVCMYTSTDECVGSPIRADGEGNIFRIIYGDAHKPDDCDCVSFFGQVTPGNCNTNHKNDNTGGIYINYYTEKSLKNRTSTTNDAPKTDDKDKDKSTKQYFNDIIVRTARTEALAKSKITVEGYYIWDQNLSPDVRDGGKWEGGGQYTYIGYSITNDPKQAIRDIRVATFTPSGQIQFGDITYGCAGTLGFPATSKEENSEYPQNLDGLFITRNEKAGTPIEVGKLHLVKDFSDAEDGWEAVTTFSGLVYNFNTTRYNKQGSEAYLPGRKHVYPFEYTGYYTETDHTWENTDCYLYYEPEMTYDSETKYLSEIYFAFGTDSENEGRFDIGTSAHFNQLVQKLKTVPNATVLEDLNLAKSFNFKGYVIDSNQKYLHLCYTWSYNPYRALYGIAAFRGTVNSPNLPYTMSKATSYQGAPSGAADKSINYTSVSVVVQRTTQGRYVVRGISPENAYMTTTGLLGKNEKVPKGYTEDYLSNFLSYRQKTAFIPTGLYVSGYTEGKKPLTLDDVIISSTPHNATVSNGETPQTTEEKEESQTTYDEEESWDYDDDEQSWDYDDDEQSWDYDDDGGSRTNDQEEESQSTDEEEEEAPLEEAVSGTLSIDVTDERTLSGKKAQGVFTSVQDLMYPNETEPFNIAYPNWTSDENDKFEAGTPLYIYFRNTVVYKKYISRIFVGQCSRKDAKTDDEDKLKEFDKVVDINALIAATAAGSDEVIPVNVAADQDKAWYSRKDSNGRLEIEPAEDQPAAYISVARTDKEEEAIRGIMLYKSSPDKAVPNQLVVDGATYYCASNSSPIRMSNGNSYFLYYSYNMGVSPGRPITHITAGSEPFKSRQATALVTDKADTSDSKAVLYGDTTMKTFIRAAFENGDQVYFNKIYAASGSDKASAKLKLLEQGCTEYCDINLNEDAGGNAVYFGYRSYMLNEKAIRMKNTDEAKAAERAYQLSQAIYDIVCTVDEPYKPEGFVSQRYQIYYAPVVVVDKKTNKMSGVNLNEGTTGPEIYMYYATPYGAKEYNERAKTDKRAILSSMPNNYFSAPLTKIAFSKYDRVPYSEDVEASTSEQSNLLRWEYIMQSNNKQHIDLNEGAIKFDSDYRTSENRISMFAQREDGSVKPSAEITGGYIDEYDDIGYLLNVK